MYVGNLTDELRTKTKTDKMEHVLNDFKKLNETIQVKRRIAEISKKHGMLGTNLRVNTRKNANRTKKHTPKGVLETRKS